MTIAINDLVNEFEQVNESITHRAEQVFSDLCSDRANVPLFLNTLSYMEHIGSYKIMATQSSGVLDYPTLKHLNEETGHAVLFKRHAERLGGEGIDYSEDALLVPATARAYFNRLEVSMVRTFGVLASYRTIYLLMSLIIEFRAVWAYRILQRALDDNGLNVSLDRLLAEEQGHLYSMARRLDEDGQFEPDLIRKFWHKEQELFVRLLSSLERLRPESDLNLRYEHALAE